MDSALTLIAGAFALVLVAMTGLGAGVLLKKRTPLRGSCRGASCELGGPDRHDGACLCAQQDRRPG